MRNVTPTRNRLFLVIVLFMCAMTTGLRTCAWTYHEAKHLRGFSSAGTGCYDMYEAKALCATTLDCSGITIEHGHCGGAQWTLRKFELNTGVAGQHTWEKGACADADGGAVDNTDCPPGFFGLANTNKCYRFDSNSRSQQDAKTLCEGMGGRLPVVASIQENGFIASLTGWTGRVWLGLQKPTDDGTWAWRGYPGNTFTNWINWNEPNMLPNEHCGTMHTMEANFAWNAAVCNLADIKTVCEVDRLPRSTCAYTYEAGKALRAWSSVGYVCFDLHEAKAMCSRTASCAGITVQQEYCGGGKWSLRRHDDIGHTGDAGMSSWVKGECSPDGGAVDSTDCPTGYVGLAGTNKCYHYDNTTRTQQDSKTFCQGMGGKLPIVESIEENAFIAKQSGWRGNVWIGFQKPTDAGTWAWENDAPNTYTNWFNVNEPYLRATELCSAIFVPSYNFNWNAATCDRAGIQTVCEAERIPQPIIECPAGFNRLAGTNKCYKNFPGQVGQHSWSQAKTFCEGMGAKLPVVTTIEENQFVVDQTGGAGVVWIGFTDQAEEGNWVWANGEANAYTHWMTNEPQDFRPLEDCAAIWTPEVQHKWNGFPCSGVRGLRNILSTVCETTTESKCPVHYVGGCSGSRGINKYQDKAYTVAECADKCRAETEPCVGFFVDNVRAECVTAKAGCTNNHDTRFKYFLIDECEASVPEPVYDCPKTYDGGCSLGGGASLTMFQDHNYTPRECAKLCFEEPECAGFFIGKDDAYTAVLRGNCLLVRAGCTNDHNSMWSYYAKDTCQEAEYTVVNFDVVLTGSGLDCNALATELKYATATRLGVPASQIRVDQSGCSRRRRLSQEYLFGVAATVLSELSHEVLAQVESPEFKTIVAAMMQTAFQAVDGADFTGFELVSNAFSPTNEAETDETAVPIAAACGAAGGAALVVGAYFAFRKGKNEDNTRGQDQV